MDRNKLALLIINIAVLLTIAPVFAEDAAQTAPAAAAPSEVKVTESANEVQIELPAASQAPVNSTGFSPETYTLGPDDEVEVAVMRHPEFSGKYTLSREGKLQYKFVGDLDASGMTKAQLEEKIKTVLAAYVIAPEVNVTITEYKSKVFYVIGEVGVPGKYFMRSETMTVREAIFNAGLPTSSAAMRKAQLITPDKSGKAKVRRVDLYALLYIGNLKKDIEVHPGDVLYVPSTVMAKVIRVINPVASTVGIAASSPDSVGKARTGLEAAAGKP